LSEQPQVGHDESEEATPNAKKEITCALRNGPEGLALTVPRWDHGKGVMARTVTVEMDEKGRVHIPSSVRREIKSRRFILSVKGGKLLMEPVRSAASVRGKYKNIIKASVEEIEEAGERFVAASNADARQKLAWQAELKDRLVRLDRVLKEVPPARKGFAAKSVREDRESH
jgi:bifunctional DNA-binding transcriptional regulator/antitoxin component of YhaV-PrlF toxin-antitoxin module